MRRTYNQKTQQLVTLAKDGDESALDQLCQVYSERVRWMVRLRMNRELRSKLESMDLAQDVLIHALRGLGDFTYKNEGDFIRWLSKIAQNALRDNLDKLHADKRNVRKELPLNGDRSTTNSKFVGSPGLIDVTTPSMIMSRREDLAKLEKAIDMVKPEYREVIVLTKIEGLSYREIGDRLSKSDDAVRMLLSRAMASLTIVFKRL
ncbi:sigma-70 family RNA polymerase sigma factor [Planctomycetota bacterium]